MSTEQEQPGVSDRNGNLSWRDTRSLFSALEGMQALQAEVEEEEREKAEKATHADG